MIRGSFSPPLLRVKRGNLFKGWEGGKISSTKYFGGIYLQGYTTKYVLCMQSIRLSLYSGCRKGLDTKIIL